MGKFADRYFGVDPWFVEETGFDPAYSEVAESIFSLGNEYMGLRGYFEEGYSGARLQGSYVNGVYETKTTRQEGYKGIPNTLEYMVNAADWVRCAVSCNGQPLDLAVCRVSGFRRAVDMRTGELTRSFVWHADEHTDVALTFRRVLSMRTLELGASKITWEVTRGQAQVEVVPELWFGPAWEVERHCDEADFVSCVGTTQTTKQKLYVSVSCRRAGGELSRVAHISRNGLAERGELERHSYDEILAESADWWRERWAVSDVEIDGPADDRQGIRYCVFQMHQHNHSGQGRVVMGAKGLTGEAYNGNTFWEAETYILPFYLFTNPAAALNVLRFRYETLEFAKERARELDCEGAFYPIATISGRESCTLWQHANTQLQVSTAVAYALWQHAKVTGDETFLRGPGIEMLVEICRMLATRGAFDPMSGEYGYYGVMGPDEFQLMVNHNRYTNFMAQKTFRFTLETLRNLGVEETDEHRDWKNKADKMRVSYDAETLLYEQHDGFFNLPHVDVQSIPAEDFPLYSHWSYDRIYRNDVIKQPDVLLFLFLYASEFSDAQVEANFDYYEPRCTHESSLSPSVHSILACRLGRMEQAYRLFRFNARLDLDNYNRNAHEGLHIPSIAGCWMNIVYGFAGLQSDGETLALNPVLPEDWRSLRFPLHYRGRTLRVNITPEGTSVALESGEPLTLRVNGAEVRAE